MEVPEWLTAWKGLFMTADKQDSVLDKHTMSSRFSPVTAIFLIVLVDVLGYTIILPILPFYAEKFGASPFTIGLLLSSFSVCQLISGPLLGSLSDRIGRRPLLLLSQMGTCIGFLVLAFAGNLFWVFVGRIIDGLTAGNISLAQATISDYTAPQNRARAFSKIGIAFGLGFLVGPGLSGLLVNYSYQLPVLVGAALSALSIAGTFFLLPREEPSKGSSSSNHAAKFKLLDAKPLFAFFRMPESRHRLLQFFLFILSFTMYTSGISLFANRQLTISGKPFGPSEVAYILAYGGLLGIALQAWVVGRLVQKFGEDRLVEVGFLAMVLGYILLSQSEHLPLALFSLTFSSIGHGILRPVLSSLLSKSAGRSQQGAILGVNQSMQSIAQIISPVLGGALIENGLTATWAVVAGLFALPGLALERYGKRSNLGSGPQT
jgi:MFS family permease